MELIDLPRSGHWRMSRKGQHRSNESMTANNVVTLGPAERGWYAASRDHCQKVESPLMRAQQMPGDPSPAHDLDG
jgi:hypothetical protein